MSDEGWSDEERNAEANRIEKHMTLQEIFAEAFKYGQLLAGVRADTAEAYRDWLDDRLEERCGHKPWWRVSPTRREETPA